MLPNYCARVRACACSLSPPGWLTLARGLYFLFRACLLRRLVCFVRSFVDQSLCVFVLSVACLCCLSCSAAPGHFLLAHQPHAVAAQVTSCSVSSGLGGGLSKNDIPQVYSEPLWRASFLPGPAPASRVASGGHHGGQRPALKILESFGGVAAWPRCWQVCML